MGKAESVRVRIPQIKDVRTAVELYYSRLDLSNADIMMLFGPLSRATIAKLKSLAETKRQQEDVAQ